jgi:hypothetical protein
MASPQKNPASRSPASTPAAKRAETSRPRKTVEEIAIEQGAPLIADFDAMFGEGKDLWDSDEDFEEWMKGLQERRNRG